MSDLDVTWRDPVTCWTRESAMEILPVEAEAIPPALFQQAHVDLQLTQVDPESLGTVANKIREHDVLNLVKERVGGKVRRTDIIPVLGRSGAGKSHLVRWLRNELRRGPMPELRTVFIPKHRTSLRGVVERLLQAFEDVEELASVRGDLRSATDTDKTPERLRTDIRDKLCAGVEHDTDRTAVAEQEKEARDLLSGALPALLRDPHFAPHHLGPESAIARLVDEKLEGRDADDAVEIAFQFSKEDLQTNADDIGKAAAQAREAVTYLMQDPPTAPDSGRTLTELAAQMLNDQLPSAIKDVFGVGGEDLKDLLVRARSILYGREDVLLLVEDFAMFQGLHQGLLDAITLHDTENEHLCALVTVFAVTTGYYRDHLPATLKTRSSTAYIVGKQPEDAPLRFAASYLRAVRLGMDEVRARHVSDTLGKSSCDGCPVIEVCHESFGHINGEGLFPFNATMLHRAMEATADDEFNARVFLSRVLRPVLTDDHGDIERQEYPTEEAAERFDAKRHRPSGSQLLAVESREQGRRRARMALFYKNPVDSGDLASGIHAALGLPPTGLWTDEPRDTGTSTDESHGTEVPRDEPDHEELPQLVHEIHRWETTGGMSQTGRRSVRQLVATAVLDRLPFNDSGFKRSVWTDVPGPFFDAPSSVVLDSNIGVLSEDAVRLVVNSDNPKHVDALQSLAWLAERGSWREVPDGIERSARLEVALERWCEDVAHALGLHEANRDELSLVGEALEVAHALTGKVGESLAARAELLVADAEASGYPSSFAKAAEYLTTSMRRRVGYARGESGSIAAVDWPMIHGVLTSSEKGQRLLERTGKPAPKIRSVDDAVTIVANHLAEVVGAPDQLRRLTPDVTQLGDESPIDVATDLADAATGKVGHSRLEELRETATVVQDLDMEAVIEAITRLDSWDELSPVEQAALANGKWRESSARIRRFLELADEVLDAATPAGTTLGSNDRTTVQSMWEEALASAHAALKTATKDSA